MLFLEATRGRANVGRGVKRTQYVFMDPLGQSFTVLCKKGFKKSAEGRMAASQRPAFSPPVNLLCDLECIPQALWARFPMCDMRGVVPGYAAVLEPWGYRQMQSPVLTHHCLCSVYTQAAKGTSREAGPPQESHRGYSTAKVAGNLSC